MCVGCDKKLLKNEASKKKATKYPAKKSFLIVFSA